MDGAGSKEKKMGKRDTAQDQSRYRWLLQCCLVSCHCRRYFGSGHEGSGGINMAVQAWAKAPEGGGPRQTSETGDRRDEAGGPCCRAPKSVEGRGGRWRSGARGADDAAWMGLKRGCSRSRQVRLVSGIDSCWRLPVGAWQRQLGGGALWSLWVVGANRRNRPRQLVDLVVQSIWIQPPR
jgi:hypothetical protein